MPGPFDSLKSKPKKSKNLEDEFLTVKPSPFEKVNRIQNFDSDAEI